jgi:TonB-linked SusC/RagA family outer membrane protein
MKPAYQLLQCLFLLLLVQSINAQTIITGIVTDGEGKKLQGVNVTVAGSSTGTTTDANGEFKLTVPAQTKELLLSMVGYQKLSVNIEGKSEVTITLKEAAGMLGDVVVVGYGTQKRRDITGTISTVKGDDFKNLPVSNSAQALQGRASGVDIVRSDGSPGSIPAIRIRGTGTLNSSDPLVVIDGVPAGGLNDVSPNDIASIEILKDASSSAIYGTRAANGVILITTKKGNFGDKLKTSINAYAGFSDPIKYIPLLTAPELVNLKKEGFNNDGQPIPAIWNDPYYATQRTDWQKALFGTGHVTNVDAAVRGGNNTSTYSLSGNYYDEKGIIENSFFTRYSGRINSEHKIGKRVKVGENVLYAYTNGSGLDTRSTQAGLVWSALRFNPAIPVMNPDGTWGSSKADNELGDINNPVYTAEMTDQFNKNNHLLANVYGEIEIINGLKFKANWAYDYNSFNGYNFSPATPDQTRVNQLATLRRSYSEATSLLNEYFLTYNKQIEKVHNINVTAGYSAQSFKSESYYAERRGYVDPSSDHRILDNGSSANQFNGGSSGEAGLVSYFARANYGYKSKYLLTATIRADGSSKFPDDGRWGYFPAFSAGWRISEESFFKDNVNFISNLKLTGGWGQLGNQSVPDFQYLSIIRTSGILYAFGPNTDVVDGAFVVSLANPNITWERAEMTNISLEFGLLKNQLTGTITYFDKNTKDMLIPYSLVETYGANVNLSFGSGNVTIPNQNLGTLNNHGFEIDLNYQNRAGEFGYSIGANASFIKNKVTKLYGTDADYISSVLYGRESLETSRTYEGQPISSFYGFKTDGIYQNQGEIDKDNNITNDPQKPSIKPGDVRFVDINSDGVIDDDDRVNLGDPNPSAVIGINGSFDYKNFDLSLSFAGAFGFELYNADRMAGLDATQVFNYYKEQNNRWHGEGTSNSIPRLGRVNVNNNYRSSDLWVENGDYLALKNLSIGYTFQNKKIGTVPLPVIRLYATCYNVFYITDYSGYTPELGYTDGNKQRGVDVAQYPSVRTFTFGASFNF